MSLLKSRILLIFIIVVQLSINYDLALAEPVLDTSQTQLINNKQKFFVKDTESSFEPNFKQNQILDLNINSKVNSSINLDPGDTYTISSSPYQRTLQINESKAYQNLFDISSVLVPKLNTYGDGELIFQTVDDDTKLKLSVNNSQYGLYLSAPLDIVISGDEYLELKIAEISFNFNVADFAFANLVIEFNNFNLVFVFKHSQSYIDFGFTQNSTTSIKILNQLISTTIVNISDVVSNNNLDQPNLIKSISWDIYSNNPYDFSVIFSKLKLIDSVIPEIIINDQSYLLSSSQIIPLDPNAKYSINNTDSNTFIEFQAITMTDRLIKQAVSIYFNNLQLVMDGIVVLEDLDLDSRITIVLPENIIIDKLNTSLTDITLNQNLFSFVYLQKSTIQFIAYFMGIENLKYSMDDVSQGKKLMLTIYNQKLMGSKILGPNNEIGDVTYTNSTVEYFIPSNWDRGEFMIIVWFKNGTFSFISRTLELYPSKLISSTSYRFNVGERGQIPILVQNLSSLEYKKAENIYSYYQGKLFSVDNQNGITINPGDFSEGAHLLLVNATYKGLAPLIFELKIIINPFNPEIVYTIKRNDVQMISIDFSIQDVSNWSVSSFITINGEGIFETFEFWKPTFEIQLVNSNWTNSELEFDLILYLDDNLGVKYEKISVLPYEENSDNRNNSNDQNSIVLAVSLIGFVSGVVFVGYRIIKYNFGTEKISF